uniref:Reverse transcriptase zinc-binding domain-containing protein n=1 Tax=Tanacetum cinerariifolium TaxID=118510 RepID=A0A6L2LLA5_TANCI|nr:hypothetical protein [Tanacetum cinerariifolium]
MEPLPKSPQLPAITPQRTPPFTVSAPPRPSPEVVDIVRCNHNKVLSTFTRKLLGCVVCFKPKDTEMETKIKPEYKKDKVVAVTSFSGHWNNDVGDCFMINIYGPQESTAKSSFWNRLVESGKFILFGEFNTVLHEYESKKANFGHSPFKLYNSWLSRDGFDDIVKSTWDSMETGNGSNKISSYVKLRNLKNAIKKWQVDVRKNDRSQKSANLFDIHDIEKKIDDGSASISDREKRIKLLQDIDKNENLEALDLIQKARIKWDIEGDKIFKFFHGIINIKRRTQAIADEVKNAVWECGSNKAPGPDGFSFTAPCAMSNAVNSGLIRGIKLSSSGIVLSHLIYADDVIITTDWNPHDIDNIIRVLPVFHLTSGLKINIHKSNIFSIRVTNDEISSMASRTGCAAGCFSFTYLGLSIDANINLTFSWQILIDCFQKRLSSWKANLLSIAFALDSFGVVLKILGIWRRYDIGTRNTAYLNDLLLEISQIDISVDEDTCTWVLSNDGTFSVKSARHRLPHRLNLSSRGLDIPTISCSSCNGNVESADHIFFECDLVKEIWCLVRKWCDISIPTFALYDTWNSWFSTWQVTKAQSRRLYVIFAAFFWWIWGYLNSVTFSSDSIKKGDLFDNIRASSFLLDL